MVSQGLTRCGAALRFGVHALWGVGGAVVFRELCLPLLTPALLPHLKLAVGGVDQWLLLSDMDKNSDGGSSLNAGGAVDWFASQRHGSEATEAQAQAQASLAALASSMALASRADLPGVGLAPTILGLRRNKLVMNAHCESKIK